MLMEQARKDIVEYGLKMMAAGLSQGTLGNLSIYDPETGYMAIGPSGVAYDIIKPEDVVIMDLDGNIIEGTKKPSTEKDMHAAFYKAKKDKGIRACIHTHSMFCTTLACMNEPIVPVHYIIMVAGTDKIEVAPYRTFGTPELAQVAVETCGEGNVVLLENHGLIAVGTDMKAAFGLADTIENLAQVQWRCMCAGGARLLTKEELSEAKKKYRSLGK